jgi:hypothetical protein
MRYEDALDLLLARIRQGMPVQQALAGLGADEASLSQDYAVLASIGGLNGMFPNFAPTAGAWGRVQSALAAEFASGGQTMNSMKLAPFGVALAGLLASSALVMASSESGFSSVVMDFVRPTQEQEILGDDLDGDGLPDLPPPDGGESADSPETQDTVDDEVDTPVTDDVAGEGAGITAVDTPDSIDDALDSPVTPVVSPAGVGAGSADSPDTPPSPPSVASVDSPDSPATGANGGTGNGNTGTAADSPDSPVDGNGGLGSADSPDSPESSNSGTGSGNSDSPDSDDSSGGGSSGSGGSESPDSDDSGGGSGSSDSSD